MILGWTVGSRVKGAASLEGGGVHADGNVSWRRFRWHTGSEWAEGDRQQLRACRSPLHSHTATARFVLTRQCGQWHMMHDMADLPFWMSDCVFVERCQTLTESSRFGAFHAKKLVAASDYGHQQQQKDVQISKYYSSQYVSTSNKSDSIENKNLV